MKEWRYRRREDFPEPPHLADKLGVSALMASLLWRRGIGDVDGLRAYLSPLLRRLADPAAWRGAEAAATLLADCLTRGKKLAVWGDYDVDGISATALVLQVLRHYRLPVEWHVPNRQREGYGLNSENVEAMARNGVGVLLTVDCGISDHEAVARARELGMVVVISDHHLPPGVLPAADVICNPQLGGCPCDSLAGVGVVFFIMARLNALLAEQSGLPKLDMRRTLDLVALGTLADMVPLEGQNRILVKNGLLIIAEANRPGIAELKTVSGYQPLAALGAGQVVFNLAPRINAAGRMANAATALDMLCAEDHHQAHDLARALDNYNNQRRQEEERIAAQALIQAEAACDQPALVLLGPDWNQGIVGIVASRMVEQFHKPCLALCEDKGTLKGSGRSVREFHLHNGLAACSDLLIGFGGHAMAAGIRLLPEKLPEFRKRFLTLVGEALGDTPLPPVLTLDQELDFAQAADFTLLKELEMMQPFGVGNPEPVFSSPPLRIRRRRLFGPQRKHVNLELQDTTTGVTLNAKAWKQAETLPSSLEGKTVCIAYSVSIDMYNGVSNVDVKIRDMRILDETDKR